MVNSKEVDTVYVHLQNENKKKKELENTITFFGCCMLFGRPLLIFK